MLITANFVPSNFDILDFYGEEMCFAWSNNKLVIFPYESSVATSTLPTYVAPRDIKSLRCFEGRIFALCEPVGVYKFLRSRKFLPLSSAGVANGPVFYKVFVPENNWLVSQDKSTKTDTQLFQLELSSNDTPNLRDITLNAKNSESSLRKAFDQLGDDYDEDICILTNNKRVFKISRNEAQLIYCSDNEITDIVGILRGELIAGIVLVTRNAATLVYDIRGKLIFDKVYLDSDVHGLCAGISNESDNVIWLAHIDDSRIHYWVKTISENTFRKKKIDCLTFLAIRNYKNKHLICLTDMSQLHEISIDSLELGKNEIEEFVALKSEMLKGTEKIVDTICERAKELQHWNEKLLEQQEKLRRINIFSHKQTIVYLPEVRIERIAGKTFARIKFDSVLPLNCYVVFALILNRRVSYSIKYIEDSETTLDLILENGKVDNDTKIQVDLVTLAEESKAWCLIRNYTVKPKVQTDVQISKDRTKFLNAKLAALRNFTKDSDLTMEKLSTFKKNFRRELKNL